MSGTAALKSRGQSVGLRWRCVDFLIKVRRAGARLPLGGFWPVLLLAPALALVGLLIAGLGGLIWDSLHEFDTLLAEPGDFSFTQYGDVLSDPYFHTIFLRTVTMAIATTTVALMLAVPFALTMARTHRRWLRLALLVIVFLPILTGDITRTYGWLVVLGPEGPLAWLLEPFGVESVKLIGTLWAVGIGTVQVLLPVAILILLPAVISVSEELEDAARTMGARPRQVFFRVTLPQLRGAITGAAAVGFALAMTEFANPALLGAGLKSYVSNYLYSAYLQQDNAAEGATIGVILLVSVIIGVTIILTAGRLLSRRGRPA
jgi:putative spermidine/putrescine transport system permease protein